MILPLLLAAASSLPYHVSSPQPGQISVGVGVEGSLPAVSAYLPLARWIRLDLQLDMHPEAPLMAGEVVFGAGDARGPLTAHIFLGAGLRPLFNASVISGAHLVSGIGLVGVWGPWMISAEGGGAMGLSFEPIYVDTIDPLRVDQQGGLFAQQRFTLGYELMERFQINTRVSFALPLKALKRNTQNDDAFPESEVRFSGRLVIRF